MIKRIDHIAIVLGDLDGGLDFWRDTLGLELTQVQAVPEQESNVAFLPVGQSEVELVQPTSDTSGVARYQARGVRLIDETPRLGAGGKQYAFVHPESTHGVLIELYQIPPDAPAS